MHIEIRVTSEGEIIPIEINPMRFAGWCTTDLSRHAWGINIYETYFENRSLDWENILANMGDEIYYFSMAEVPSDIDRKNIKDFDYDGFLSNYSNILELRKIDYRNNPLFAVMFGSTKDKSEVRKILGLKTKDYVMV